MDGDLYSMRSPPWLPGGLPFIVNHPARRMYVSHRERDALSTEKGPDWGSDFALYSITTIQTHRAIGAADFFP